MKYLSLHRSSSFLSPAYAFFCAVPLAGSAATLSVGFVDQIQEGDTPDAVVTLTLDSSPPVTTFVDQIGVPGTTVSFDNDVVDYGFFTSSNSSPSTAYGSRIGAIVGGSNGNRNLFNIVADASAGSGGTSTGVRTNSANPAVTGSIDISGITEGSAYFFTGSWRTNGTIEVTASGAGQSDVVLSSPILIPDPNSGQSGFVAQLLFEDAENFDTLSYTYTNGDGQFSGIVLTQVPEPGASVLGFFGLLIILKRRR